MSSLTIMQFILHQKLISWTQYNTNGTYVSCEKFGMPTQTHDTLI